MFMSDRFPLAELGMHSLVVVETLESPRGILLDRKIRGFGAGKLVLPGGKSDQLVGDASPFSGVFANANAQRELLEETGIQAILRRMGRLAIFDEEGEDISIDIFTTQASRVAVGTETSSELTELAWHDVEEIPYSEMPRDYALWLPHILSGEIIDGQIQQLGNNEISVDFMFARSQEEGARMRIVA